MVYSAHTVTVYQKVLSGELRGFSSYFFDQCYRKRRVVELLKYLIEERLRWTPQEALERLTLEILKENRLDCLLRYVEKPVELEENDISYLLFYAYKGVLKEPTQEELTIRLYKKVLSGELRNFPKNYFLNGIRGEEKVKYCIQYLCNEILKVPRKNIPRSITPEILQKYKLKIVLNVIYSSTFDLITSIFPNEFKASDFNDLAS